MKNSPLKRAGSLLLNLCVTLYLTLALYRKLRLGCLFLSYKSSEQVRNFLNAYTIEHCGDIACAHRVIFQNVVVNLVKQGLIFSCLCGGLLSTLCVFLVELFDFCLCELGKLLVNSCCDNLCVKISLSQNVPLSPPLAVVAKFFYISKSYFSLTFYIYYNSFLKLFQIF